MTPKRELRFAKVTSQLVRLAATVVAPFANRMGDNFQISQGLLGVFLRPLLSCIVRSVVKARINRLAMVIGMLPGFAAGWGGTLTEVHNLWAPPAAFLFSFAVALILFQNPVPSSSS